MQTALPPPRKHSGRYALKSLEIDPPVTISIGGNLRGLLVEMRPREWSKNLLVFSGVIFSKSLTDSHNLWVSLLGFLIFCCASSGVYLFNDLCDLRDGPRAPDQIETPACLGRTECKSRAFCDGAAFFGSHRGLALA